MKKRHAFFLAFGLLAMGIQLPAEAKILAFAPNQADGKVILTDTTRPGVCSNAAMVVVPNLPVLTGCWGLVDGELFIMWDDEEVPRYYDLTEFTFNKEAN